MYLSTDRQMVPPLPPALSRYSPGQSWHLPPRLLPSHARQPDQTAGGQWVIASYCTDWSSVNPGVDLPARSAADMQKAHRVPGPLCFVEHLSKWGPPSISSLCSYL